ncbi:MULTISPECIES: MFS transporter [Lysinibacillus]|uniref:MFS transporter n=1 Tax=Lysinibacillus antri TaxID=2498145 RepID=A0A3S0PN79_9BACI|nr:MULTISPECIES: MFS transporter [Lysinibacillus]RUL49879.1 MFS transporter [Lysinibacillus antri]TSI05076.1 MFS transporter [Lysinibacillus sp. BW-2-10]
MENSEGKIWTGQFFVALINNFFLFIVYYALLTILPVYIINDLKGTEGQAGLAITIFMLSAIAVRPFAGKIIEKFGKRKILLISELFFCISTILYVFIDSLPLLFALRLFHGIWFSLVTTVLISIVNDIIPDSRKGAGIGYFSMSSNLAVVFGPFIALTTIQWSTFKILVIALATAVVIGYLFAFTLKVREYQVPRTTEKRARLTLHDLFEVKALPIAIIAGLTAFAYTSVMSFISVYAETKDVFEYVSLFFVVFAVAMMSVRPITGPLYDTKGPSAVLYPSFIFFAAGLFLLSTMDSAVTLFIAAVLIGVGYGSVVPCAQALAIQSAEKHRSAHATSTFWTFFDSGMALGAFSLGIVSAHWGYSSLYVVCGFVIIFTIVIYWLLLRGHKKVTYTDSASVQGK